LIVISILEPDLARVLINTFNRENALHYNDGVLIRMGITTNDALQRLFNTYDNQDCPPIGYWKVFGYKISIDDSVPYKEIWIG
jgi:hypothetical protein